MKDGRMMEYNYFGKKIPLGSLVKYWKVTGDIGGLGFRWQTGEVPCDAQVQGTGGERHVVQQEAQRGEEDENSLRR